MNMARTLLTTALAGTLLLLSLPVQAQRYCHHGHCHYARHPPVKKYVPHRHPRRVFDDDNTGVYLGVGLMGDFMTETENRLSRLMETGGGMDLFFGLRFNEFFALEIGFLGSVHSTDPAVDPNAPDGILNGITFDGKVFLLPQSPRIEPFLQVGCGGYGFYEEGYENEELTGGGFHLGGGVDIRVSRNIGFGIRGIYKGIYMDNETEWYPATESVYLNQFTLEGNLQIWF